MGHGSKEMVFEVYGNYVKGLEHDREKVLNYLAGILSPAKTTKPRNHKMRKFLRKPGYQIV
jgi:integrase